MQVKTILMPENTTDEELEWLNRGLILAGISSATYGKLSTLPAITDGSCRLLTQLTLVPTRSTFTGHIMSPAQMSRPSASTRSGNGRRSPRTWRLLHGRFVSRVTDNTEADLGTRIDPVAANR